MRLQDIGEFGLIQRLSRGCLVRADRVIKGIGDDCAAVFPVEGQALLVTTDLLAENIHFFRHATSAFNLGYKSLAVNLSDIAAMGGNAHEAFVSIAIPPDCPVDFIEEFFNGIKHLAAQFQVNILGGDTTRSSHGLVINITVIGAVPENEMLCRNGAEPGDVIYTTGFLGDSRAGLQFILKGSDILTEADRYLFNAHILPKAYLAEGRFLAKSRIPSSCIDISDGLSSDLHHILTQSRVGAILYADRIPVSDPLKTFCRSYGLDPIAFSLAGGEDYTLLLTSPRRSAEGLSERYKTRFQTPLYAIGEITDSGIMQLQHPDGPVETISPSGWDHFSNLNRNERYTQ